MIKKEMLDKSLAYIQANLSEIAINLVTALIVFWVGLKIIGYVKKLVEKLCLKKKMELGMAQFLAVATAVLLRIVLIIGILSYLGFDTTSLSALVASAGLAIGFALKGSLSNLAGGVLIVGFKPFKIGETISAQGEIGTVSEIKLMNTVILTGDNKTVFLPNGPLATGKVVNFSRQETRRVDLIFGIGYDDDLKKAKSLLQDIANADERVIKEKPIVVAVHELADSSVNFTFRVFVNKADYWAVYWDTIEKVKLSFDENGISIPFPQRDVHIHNN